MRSPPHPTPLPPPLPALQVAVLVPAALGRFTLWGAVLVDVGSSLLVVANALR